MMIAENGSIVRINVSICSYQIESIGMDNRFISLCVSPSLKASSVSFHCLHFASKKVLR